MNQLAPTQPHPLDVLKRDIGSNIRFYGTLMKAGDEERARFIAEIIQAAKANPKIINAERGSLLLALGEAAAMGLSVNPSLGEAYLIPRNRSYKDKNDKWQKVLEVNFQPGYKGLVKLAYRSNLIDRIYTNVVYAGERYVETGGLEPNIVHEIDHDKRTGDAKDIVAAYAVVKLKGSTEPLFETLGKGALVRIAESSGDPRKKEWSDVWKDHFEPMARKSALIRLCKLLPRNDELRSLHMVVERDSMREVGKEPERLDALNGIRLPSADGSGLDALMAGADESIDVDSTEAAE
jgi:recombination protein RecT